MTLRAHYSMCRFAERKTGNPALDNKWVRLIKVPRGVGKSTLITQIYGIQMAMKYPDKAILIANETERGAMKFLGAIKDQFTDNKLLRALFPERIPEDPEHQCKKWSETEVVLPRESSRQEPTFQAIGVGGSITGMHPDLAIVDDMISDDAMENARIGSFLLFEKTNRWISRLRPLVNMIDPDDGILFVGCVAEHSRVLMADGSWREVQDVKVGEKVMSWNREHQTINPEMVTAVVDQGYTEAMTIATDRHTIRVTPNHPFLKVRGKKKNKDKWVEAQNLRAGDKVEVIQTIPDFCFGPDADPEWFWLMGFLWGDGWVTKYVGKTKRRGTSYRVCVALGVDDALNQYVTELLQRFYPGRYYRDKKGCLLSDNNAAGVILENYGLTPGVRATDKKVPDWVFTVLPDSRRQFLLGLIAADGYDEPYTPKDGIKGMRLSTSSKELAEGVRMLALTCGLRPTKVYYRSRVGRAPNSPPPTVSHEYVVALRDIKSTFPIRRWKIKKVEKTTHIRTFDLSVENSKNFICEGFVVHNTPWWEGDSYEFIEKAFGYGEKPVRYKFKHAVDDGTVEVECYTVGDLAVYARPILENGTSFFPERWSDDRLAKMRQDDPLLFAANMMLNPTAPEVVVFKPSWRRYFEWSSDKAIHYRNHALADKYLFVDDLDVVVSVDPAFTEGGTTSARQAIVATGGTPEGLRLILRAQATRQSLDGFVKDIVETCKRFKARKFLIERQAQQIAFINTVRQAFRDADVRVSFEEVTSGGKNKDLRIATLETFFERGQIYGERTQHDFWREYDTFPRGKMKDLLDTLAYQPAFWNMGTGATKPQQQERVNREVEQLYARMGKASPVSTAGSKSWERRADGSRR